MPTTGIFTPNFCIDLSRISEMFGPPWTVIQSGFCAAIFWTTTSALVAVGGIGYAPTSEPPSLVTRALIRLDHSMPDETLSVIDATLGAVVPVSLSSYATATSAWSG